MIGNIKLGIVLPTWLTRTCPANHSCGADDVNVELYYLFSSADILEMFNFSPCFYAYLGRVLNITMTQNCVVLHPN